MLLIKIGFLVKKNCPYSKAPFLSSVNPTLLCRSELIAGSLSPPPKPYFPTTMASAFIRSVSRPSVSSLGSLVAKSKAAANQSQCFAPTPCLARRSRFVSSSKFSNYRVFSGSPVELGCFEGSPFLKQSVMATAGLASPLSLTSPSSSLISQGTISTF